MPPLKSPAVPEHEKLQAISEQSQAIHDFVEWLAEENIRLVQFDERERSWEWPRPLKTMLAQFFKIDLDKLEAEKDAMLEFQRLLNAKNDAVQLKKELTT